MRTLLDKKDILKIADNMVFTNHCLARIEERMGKFTEQELIEKVRKAANGWNNVDNTINIVLDDTFYIIFKKDLDKFVAITIKGESKNGVSISRKIYLALQRKSFKTENKLKIDKMIQNARRKKRHGR